MLSVYTLETSDRKFQRHCLQSILTDLRCLWRQQRSRRATFAAEEAMLIVVC